jgi:hypothetical protein
MPSGTACAPNNRSNRTRPTPNSRNCLRTGNPRSNPRMTSNAMPLSASLLPSGGTTASAASKSISSPKPTTIPCAAHWPISPASSTTPPAPLSAPSSTATTCANSASAARNSPREKPRRANKPNLPPRRRTRRANKPNPGPPAAAEKDASRKQTQSPAQEKRPTSKQTQIPHPRQRRNPRPIQAQCPPCPLWLTPHSSRNTTARSTRTWFPRDFPSGRSSVTSRSECRSPSSPDTCHRSVSCVRGGL